jgi:hypothetical protein
VHPDALQALRRAVAKTLLFGGLFLLVTGGVGFVVASQDPVHTTGDQLALVALGIALTAAGRLVPR